LRDHGLVIDAPGGKRLRRRRENPILRQHERLGLEDPIMISALEIGFLLSASLLALAFAVAQRKPKPSPVRIRRTELRRRPQD
jgi:hypothetical protein